jgi:2'-5' RNA ligase
MTEGSKSGLVVEIPEAENVVATHRLQLDGVARLGVPAHVTVLFPFAPPEQLAPPVLRRLETLFAGVAAFPCTFARTAWFDETVLWLAPQDPDPFRALTDRVFAAFPHYPPFEGVFEQVVPHLTIGQDHELSAMRAAEESIRPGLPVHGRVREVTLLTQAGPGARWQRTATFPLC